MACQLRVGISDFFLKQLTLHDKVVCSFLTLILHQAIDEKLRRTWQTRRTGRPAPRSRQAAGGHHQQARAADSPLRMSATGSIGPVFRAACVALSANVRDALAA